MADDHAIVREGLRRVLSQLDDMVVVGEASSGEAALELVARRRPEVVLMDARMPGIGGVAAAQAIASAHRDVRVVMFTAHAEQDLLWEALDAGAQGFVLKDSDSAALVGAIRQVVAGEPYVDPRLAPDFLRQLARPRSGGILSAREREILQMLADGHSNREVSERAGRERRDGQDPRQAHPGQAGGRAPHAGGRHRHPPGPDPLRGAGAT